MGIADVNGLRMYYELRGDGPPLVLIPGLGAPVKHFMPLADALAAHFRVLAFDNRGAGGTDKPDEPYSIEMMADDTIGLLAELGITKAHVAGISMGGRIAMELAVRRPDLVDRLALVSTVPKVRNTVRRKVIMGVMARLHPASASNPQPRYAFERQLAASGGYDGTGKLAHITAPTIVLHGKRDKTAQYDLATAMRDGIPGATMVTFDGGHVFMMTAERKRFIDELTSFLSAG